MYLVGATIDETLEFYALAVYSSEERADKEHEKLRKRLKLLEMKVPTTCVGVPVDMDIIESFEYWSK